MAADTSTVTLVELGTLSPISSTLKSTSKRHAPVTQLKPVRTVNSQGATQLCAPPGPPVVVLSRSVEIDSNAAGSTLPAGAGPFVADAENLARGSPAFTPTTVFDRDPPAAITLKWPSEIGSSADSTTAALFHAMGAGTAAGRWLNELITST